ncbi:MAG TPA: hypothetical protein VKT82_34145 [Ktedonobacterales bacterium]|nr:hypothetical protein [Ktedonobacterales bacterium]
MAKVLFLQPQVQAAQRPEATQAEKFVVQALGNAGRNDEFEVVEVADITDDLIKRVHLADLLIVDANDYEAKGSYNFSPYLFYLLALGHCLGNHTMLLAKTQGHLPLSLARHHHTFINSQDMSQPFDRYQDFFSKFRIALNEILVENNSEADNPIQAYISRRKIDAELARGKNEVAAKDAQIEELTNTLRQRGGQRPSAEPQQPPIQFREVRKG